MQAIENSNPLSKDTPLSNGSSDWFNDMVASIRSDEAQLAAGIANPDKAAFYKSALSGNRDEMLNVINTQFSRTYISEMLLEYFGEINKRSIKPIQLYVYHTINTLHVWAIIADDDMASESSLFLAEAAVNANYSKLGYTIDTIILETSDNYPVPNHFIKVI